MPLPDLVREVAEVLSRADALFGTTGPGAPGTAVDALTDAADALAAGRQQAAAMAGDVLTNYADFAQSSGEDLDRLSDLESGLTERLLTAAEAVAAAKATSRSALDVASSASDALDALPDTPAAELAVLHALRAQVGNELRLIRTHQAVATQLAEQLRGLAY